MTSLPNFVVIGAPKCGTTSLFYYLRQHPDVYLPRQKELHYFTYEELNRRLAGPGDTAVLEMACATRRDYEACYASVREEVAVGDISPSYFQYADVAERIRRELRDPRIVLLLRNPIQKTYSQYMHLVRDARETLSFPEALKAESARIQDSWANIWHYAAGALFADRTQHYLAVFGRDRVRIILFEELVMAPSRTMRELCLFLGIDPEWEFKTSTVYNRSGRPRSKLVAGLMARPGRLLKGAAEVLPEGMVRRAKTGLSRLNVAEKGEIDESSRALLRELVVGDVRRLEGILARSLELWQL